MADQLPSIWRRTLKRRVLVAAVGFALWAAAIEVRLVYLQVFQRAELQTRAQRQQLRTIPAPAKRGEILDRRGHLLAYSVDADSIYAVPTEIRDAARTASALCAALDRCSAGERAALAQRLARPRPFTFVSRHVSPDEARRVAALNLEGIGFIRENRRFYPKKELAAHLVGYVGIDNVGLEGLEAAYDEQIRGQAGAILIQTDARRHAFSRLERPPTSGSTLELTIDEYLQHIAERELRAGVLAHRADGGSVIIMDPLTGEILALANEPTFNPNMFRTSQEAQRRNRAVQDLYEPGSTFKVVTASAALEEKVLAVGDPVDVSAGMVRIGTRQIDDVARYGVLSFRDVIVKSSNVGAIKIGLRLGADRLGRYVRRFGFGSRLSRDFPAESAGIVWDPGRWTDSALASISMGYQIGVTPLQMLTAVSAIANGGELVEPRAVHAAVQDGRRFEVPRRVVRRAVSRETALELTSMMEGVVERGTARRAQIPGYTVAGKTGTSAKLVNGRYSHSDYNASFVGFVPSRQPALVVLVVIDSPRAGAYFGGAVAAPIFRQIAEPTLRYLGLGPTLNPAPAVLVARGTASPSQMPTPVAAPAERWLETALDSARDGTMPDLRGLSAREAIHALARLGLAAEVDGSGVVTDQAPAPGTPLDSSVTCHLWLGRQAATLPASRP